AALTQHLADVTRAHNRAQHVRVHHFLEVADINLRHRLRGVDAGVVHQNVNAAKLRFDPLKQRLDAFVLADVGAHKDGFAVGVLDPFHGFAAGPVARVGNDDGRAGFRQTQSDGRADALGAAGDDGDLAAKVHKFLDCGVHMHDVTMSLAPAYAAAPAPLPSG